MKYPPPHNFCKGGVVIPALRLRAGQTTAGVQEEAASASNAASGMPGLAVLARNGHASAMHT